MQVFSSGRLWRRDPPIYPHALRDQALAALFHRSGWTQEELAKVEHLQKSRIAQRLLFGRFLSTSTTGGIPRNVTERTFRSYWERTDKAEKNERIRFRAVLELILLHQDQPRALRPLRWQGDRASGGRRFGLRWCCLSGYLAIR